MMLMRIIKLYENNKAQLPISAEKEGLATNNFSFISKFNPPPCELTQGTPSKQTNLSFTFFLKLSQTDNFSLIIFHNLFYPETIYNNQIEKIKWSLKCKEEEICSGNSISGHPFQFDWDLIQSNSTNGSLLTDGALAKNIKLENSIKAQLEELNKHFFTINLNLSSVQASDNYECEIKFEFPDFRLGKSVSDVHFSFNNVVPVVDVIRKQESYEGLKNGFNLWTLSKTDSSNFLGLSSLLLKNKNNRVLQISELDFENDTNNISNYKLLSPESYPDKEQEILYLKNYIPIPFAKSDKVNLMNKLNDSNKTGIVLTNNEKSIIESALNRNFSEKSGNGNNVDLILNNCFEDKAEVIANYFYDTSKVSQSEKQIFLNGNPVSYERVEIEFENSNKISAHSLSSQFDFYNAACEFFESKNISEVIVTYNRDFNPNGIWEALLNVQIDFTTLFKIDFQQWTHFISICRTRCLYADIKIKFSYSNAIM